MLLFHELRFSQQGQFLHILLNVETDKIHIILKWILNLALSQHNID